MGILYLSLKWHKLHPNYIETRINNDGSGYAIKVRWSKKTLKFSSIFLLLIDYANTCLFVSSTLTEVTNNYD